MKRVLSTITIFLLITLSSFSQQIVFEPADWQNPAIFEKGQNLPHAFHIPYASAEEALRNNPAEAPNFQLLNGPWKFKWVERPDLVPEDFYKSDFDTRDWDKIDVPSNWQMKGYGHAKFRNIAMTIETKPPYIPAYYNPTGCYKREFTIPSNWSEKEVMLRFEGIKSASYVWVNGQRVGYNQGGFEPAEYNITSFLKKGKNDLSVQVMRFCDGSFLENQDMWRLSGIYRDVKLYAQPKTYIQDIFVVTDLDEDYTDAQLRIEVSALNAMKNVQSGSLMIDVLDENSQSILRSSLLRDFEIEGRSTEKILLSTQVENPDKWSAEHPNLYTLLVELKDERDKTTEAFTQKIGFREVEVNGEVILVNGVPVKFNGVNSHMHHPQHGQAVPLEILRQDLLIMKQFNINCVRTSHYPPTSEYLEMADELGLYIFDEVGDEAHDNIELSSDPSYTEMYKDRSRKLVHRDRNHPSVVVWSAGNESGSGENIKAVIETGKVIDPSRPAWMYGGNTFYIPFEDITGPRYWIPYQLKNLAERKILGETDLRPSFMDEYLAATGNGLGGMDEYWELIYNYPRLSGGAIWDWISPGVNTPLWLTPDASAHGNDGAIMGRPTFVEGRNGRALKFSGHDDWIEFCRDPSLDITSNQLTISFWVNPMEIPQPNTFLTKGKHQYGLIMSSTDSLEFYLQTNNLQDTLHSPYYSNNSRRISAKAKVQPDWYGNWHHVAGIYNGASLQLFVDSKLVAETAFSGNISHSPFPLCIGREAETQDQGEYSGRMSNMILDDVMIFNQAISLKELQSKSAQATAALALDFEEDTRKGDFFAVGLGGRTYGIIWPDRKIQPEIHQIKKSAQPIQVKAIDLNNGQFLVKNRHHFKNLNEFSTYWELLKDGEMIHNGELQLELAAQTEREISIPLDIPQVENGAELILTISFALKEATAWAEPGYEVAWSQFVFPSEKEFSRAEEEQNSAIEIIESENEITLKGEQFDYSFNRETGQFSKLNFEGFNYLEEGPVFGIWRAPLANDIDPWGSYQFTKTNFTTGLGRSIDNQIRTLGLKDLVNQVDEITARNRSDSSVDVTVHAWSNSTNQRASFERKETYRVYPDGTIELEQEIIPHGTTPDLLPRLGLQFQLDKAFNIVDWYGRGPFETYPDRKTGAKIGLYQSNTDREYVPYIIPQDYGNHTDVRWLKVSTPNDRALLIKSDELLNFSLKKYSTDNLSRAMYTYQLKEAPFNTLTVDYEVSGVGGTAIRQLEKYRVKPQAKTYRLTIKPLF